MSGEDAVRGFRYQFLCTLEYALRSWLSESRDLTDIVVDASRAIAGSGADAEIVDFEIVESGRSAIAAQVKSGAEGSQFRVADAVRVLQRLLTNTSERYVIITNRQPGPGLWRLRDLLADPARNVHPVDHLRADVLSLLDKSSKQLRQEVVDAEDWWLDRLRQVEIVIDNREVEEVEESVRELVRAARHRADPASIGWDAAGLIAKYLIAVTMDAAAGDGHHRLSRDGLTAHLRVDPDLARALLHSQEWAIQVLPAPRSTDVARNSVLMELSSYLSTPVRSQTVPICVLSGLSGIGKSSIATAWADDRADAYSEIYWIEASNTAAIATSFGLIEEWLSERRVRMIGTDTRSRVFSGLAVCAKPWLIVFDNVADPRVASRWIPPRGLGHVIVTTVRPRSLSGPRIREMEIPPMSVSESVRLLSLRLAGNSVLDEGQVAKLSSLASKLNEWPLALEIAAAYLLNSLEGIAGIDEFEQLIMRSLDDEPSVPHDYPTTLVRAIDLSWGQMISREDIAFQRAVFALKCSGFAGSRQIPLQILMTASVIDFDSMLNFDPTGGFIGYALKDPPPGEIFRAMRSYSLTSSDLPFVDLDGEGISPASFGFTVQVNEIVQAIIRERFLSADDVETSINSIALVTQHWLSAAHERRNFDLLQAFIGHAVVASEYAIQYGVKNLGVAFLWGNTATVLRTLGYPGLAVPYFRQELELFHSRSKPVPVYQMQAAASLADVLIQSAADRRAVLDEVSTILEECLSHVPASLALDYKVTASTVRSALVATLSLFPECSDNQRICAIRDKLTALVNETPISEGPDAAGDLMEIGRMIESGEYRTARPLIEQMLSDRDVRDPESATLLRFIAECQVGLGDWQAARETVGAFSECARKMKLYQEEAGIFCRNVGVTCFAEVIIARNSEATDVFGDVVDFFDETVSRGQQMDLVARSTGLVLSALHACINHDLDTARSRLQGVGIDNLPIFSGISMMGLVYRLLDRLVSVAPCDLVKPAELGALTRPEGNGACISNIPKDIFLWATVISRPETAVLTGILATQWKLSAGRKAGSPVDIAMELKFSLQTMGIESDLVEIKVDVFRVGLDFVVPENIGPYRDSTFFGRVPVFTSKTFGLWVEAFGSFIDPTVPALALRYRNLTRHPVAEEFPVIYPSGREVFDSTFHMLRSRHVVRYSNMRLVELSDDAWSETSARTQVECAVDGLLTAMCGLAELYGQSEERVRQISSVHPQLAELASLYRGIASPDRWPNS